MLRYMLTVILGLIVAIEAQDWDSADQATRRLAPRAFLGLPLGIRSELEHRGCTIPQPFTAQRPENVIKGRFTSSSRIDWAVLCSRQRISTILVFRGGAPSSAVELAPESDLDALQTIDGAGTIGYSRAIAVVSAQYFQDHYKIYDGPKPPHLDHDSINDIFIEKGSVIWYWYGGRWRQLPGAD